MKLLSDVNVLLALVAENNGHHAAVRHWWERQADDAVIHICRPVQMGFLRLLCSETVMREDTQELPEAWAIYATLINSRRFTFVLEPAGLDAAWAGLCRPFKRSPKVVMDAYLAAFATAGGFTLVTLDQAFAQFRGLPVIVPVTA